MTLFVPSMQYNKTGKTQILQKCTVDSLSCHFYWGRMEQFKNVDIDSFSVNVHLLIVFILELLFLLLFAFFWILMDDCHDILLCCVSKCSFTRFSKNNAAIKYANIEV